MSDDDHVYRVGELVQVVPREGAKNAVGDGILWQVIQLGTYVNSKGVRTVRAGRHSRDLHVVPAWCATGFTRTKAKWVRPGWDHVIRVDFARLGVLRTQLDGLCRAALALECCVSESRH